MERNRDSRRVDGVKVYKSGRKSETCGEMKTVLTERELKELLQETSLSSLGEIKRVEAVDKKGRRTKIKSLILEIERDDKELWVT